MSNWRDEALCAETDPRLFHPEKGESAAPARRICGNCSVRREYLEYALTNGENDGVWGGLIPGERRALLRKSQTEPVRWVGVDRAEVARLSAQKLSVRQIAKRMQTTSQTVRRCLDELAA